MKKFYSGIALAAFMLCASNNALATIDYGDAVGYGEASNEMGIWQRLGAFNGVDDGVTWSVDGGKTYGNGALIIGQKVTFKFDFWQGNNGIHTYDQLLAVVDANKDFIFGMDSTEKLIYTKIDTLTPRDQTPDDLSDARFLEYLVTWDVPGTILADSTTWLRARVTCNHTLFPNMTPYGFIQQGETEDYQLTFKAAPVPEPATMLLFGSGIAGLAGLARRKRS